MKKTIETYLEEEVTIAAQQLDGDTAETIVEVHERLAAIRENQYQLEKCFKKARDVLRVDGWLKL